MVNTQGDIYCLFKAMYEQAFSQDSFIIYLGLQILKNFLFRVSAKSQLTCWIADYIKQQDLRKQNMDEWHLVMPFVVIFDLQVHHIVLGYDAF